MFPAFPGFENVPLRVEVEWQGRMWPVEIRLEQLPTIPVKAVPVCSFPEEPEWGECLLTNGNGTHTPWTLETPHALLRPHALFRDGRVQPDEQIRFNFQRVEKLRQVVQRALNPPKSGMQLLKAVQYSHLPALPRVALLSDQGGLWVNSWKPTHDTVARFAIPENDFQSREGRVRQWIWEQWEISGSDVHFAWQWAQWDNNERLFRSLGSHPAAHQLEQVLKWVLLCSPGIRQRPWRHSWKLSWNPAQQSVVWDAQTAELTHWERWLAHIFSKHQLAGWIERHLCVRDFWRQRSLIVAQIDGPPTLHEYLEARLALREWLADKAPTEQVELLLGEAV